MHIGLTKPAAVQQPVPQAVQATHGLQLLGCSRPGAVAWLKGWCWLAVPIVIGRLMTCWA